VPPIEENTPQPPVPEAEFTNSPPFEPATDSSSGNPPSGLETGVNDPIGNIETVVGNTPLEPDSRNTEGDQDLRLERDIPVQTITPGSESLSFTIPSDTFVHTDSSATLTLIATMVDGSPLPEWLSFNPATGDFRGEPPASFQGELQIKVTARDDAGRQAETILRMTSNANDATGNSPAGNPGEGQAGQTEPSAGQGVPLSESADPLPVITTVQGFPVRVDETGGPGRDFELRIDKAIPDQVFAADTETFTYQVPLDAFVHTDKDARVTLTALMDDGSALPGWLSFDGETGKFTGVPEGFVGELLIKVIARDEQGRQAETVIRIRVGNPAADVLLKGKPTLTAQLKAQGVFAWKAERDHLLQHAREAAQQRAERQQTPAGKVMRVDKVA